jgi:glycosyltransferase involved in cell wall biosynthesis
MKIGFVSRIREPWGGSEELWAAAAQQLMPVHSVVISALNTGKPAPRMQALIDQGAHLVYRRGFIKPGLSASKRIPRKIAVFAINKMANPYKEFFHQKPDVIVYTGTGDALVDDPYFLELLYHHKVPLVYINQGHYEYIRTFDDFGAEILKRAYQYAALNLFVADRNRQVLERFLAADIPNAHVVRNPVNLVSTEACAFPENEKVQFAIVANLLVNHKGHDIAFDVLRGTAWQNRNWHLNIYGAGVDEAYMKRLVAYFRLDERVSFHGKVADIRNLWAHNHIALMPSRFEGIPLAVVEAMICGRPVVATDVAGHTEWIREGVDGYIAGGANVSAFGDAMERAWQNRSRWEEMGLSARVRALELYDPNPGATLKEWILKSATPPSRKEI